MKANFDSMYSCTACETSYNVLSHSHVIFWWLGHFLGEERERERETPGLVLISSDIFEL